MKKVNIIAGEVNSGKTSKLLEIYHQAGQGDGFINAKIYIGLQYAGQRIVWLSTGESMDFSYRKDFIPDNWDEKYCYDAYSFSNKALDFADQIISEALKRDAEPVFLDEIGPLELQNKGFYDILKRILSSNREIYITVRKSCVEQVIMQFNITNYNIISIQ